MDEDLPLGNDLAELLEIEGAWDHPYEATTTPTAANPAETTTAPVAPPATTTTTITTAATAPPTTTTARSRRRGREELTINWNDANYAEFSPRQFISDSNGNRRDLLFRLTTRPLDKLTATNVEPPPAYESAVTVAGHAGCYALSQDSAHDSASAFFFMPVYWLLFKALWLPFKKFLASGILAEGCGEFLLLAIDRQRLEAYARYFLDDADAPIIHDLSDEKKARRYGIQGPRNGLWCTKHGEVVVTGGIIARAISVVYRFDLREPGPGRELLELILTHQCAGVKDPNDRFCCRHVVGTYPAFQEQLRNDGEFAAAVINKLRQCVVEDWPTLREGMKVDTAARVYREHALAIRAACRRELLPDGDTNDKFVVFDFDKTLSVATVRGAHEADSGLFGGSQRLRVLYHMFDVLVAAGAKCCLCTLNNVGVVSKALYAVGLFDYFEGRLWGGTNIVNGDKASFLKGLLGGAPPKNVLLVDDNNNHVHRMKELFGDDVGTRFVQSASGMSVQDVDFVLGWMSCSQEAQRPPPQKRKKTTTARKTDKNTTTAEENPKLARPHMRLKGCRVTTVPLPFDDGDGRVKIPLRVAGGGAEDVPAGTAINKVLTDAQHDVTYVHCIAHAIVADLDELDQDANFDYCDDGNIAVLLGRAEGIFRRVTTKPRAIAGAERNAALAAAVSSVQRVVNTVDLKCERSPRAFGAHFWKLQKNVFAANLRNATIIEYNKKVEQFVETAIVVPPRWLLLNTAVLQEDEKAEVRLGNVNNLRLRLADFKGVSEDVIRLALASFKGERVVHPRGRFDGRGSDVNVQSTWTRTRRYVKLVVAALHGRRVAIGDTTRAPRVHPEHLVAVALLLRGSPAPFDDDLEIKDELSAPDLKHLRLIRRALQTMGQKTAALMAALVPDGAEVSFAVEKAKVGYVLQQPSRALMTRLQALARATDKATWTRDRFFVMTQACFASCLVPHVAMRLADDLKKKSAGAAGAGLSKSTLEERLQTSLRQAVYQPSVDGLGGDEGSTKLWLCAMGVRNPSRLQRVGSNCSFCNDPKCRRVVRCAAYRGKAVHVSWCRLCPRLKQGPKQPRVTRVFNVSAASMVRRPRDARTARYFALELRNAQRRFENLCASTDALPVRREDAARDLLDKKSRFDEHGVDALLEACRRDNVCVPFLDTEQIQRSVQRAQTVVAASPTATVAPPPSSEEATTTRRADRDHRKRRKAAQRCRDHARALTRKIDILLRSDVAKRRRDALKKELDDYDGVVQRAKAAATALTSEATGDGQDAPQRLLAADKRLCADLKAAVAALEEAKTKLEVSRESSAPRLVVYNMASSATMDDIEITAVPVLPDDDARRLVDEKRHFTRREETARQRRHRRRREKREESKDGSDDDSDADDSDADDSGDDDDGSDVDQADRPACRGSRPPVVTREATRVKVESTMRQRHRDGKALLRELRENLGSEMSTLLRYKLDLLLGKLNNVENDPADAMTDQDSGGVGELSDEQIQKEEAALRTQYGLYLQKLNRYVATCHRGYRKVNAKVIDKLTSDFIAAIGNVDERVVRRVVGIDPGKVNLYTGAVADWGVDKGVDEKDRQHRAQLKEVRKKKKHSRRTKHRLRTNSPKFIQRTTASIYHHAGVTGNKKRANRRVADRAPADDILFGDTTLDKKHQHLAHHLKLRENHRQEENDPKVLNSLARSQCRLRRQVELATVDITQNVLTLVFMGAWGLDYLGPSGRSPGAPVRQFLTTLVEDPKAIVVFLGEQFSSQVPPDADYTLQKKELLRPLKKKNCHGLNHGTIASPEGWCRRRDEVGALNILRKGLAILSGAEATNKLPHHLFAKVS